MVYVLDTNIFRKLLDHFPKKGKAFEVVWEALDEAIANKTVVSVDECFNEIANHYSSDSENFKWVSSVFSGFMMYARALLKVPRIALILVTAILHPAFLSAQQHRPDRIVPSSSFFGRYC